MSGDPFPPLGAIRMTSASPDSSSVDVLIVGAGISGIGAAYYLQREHPRRSYAILEARGASGGTWDLFRYPGIRSDSDLYTFGYEFKPWRDEQAIASADKILAYVRETAAENGIDRKIRFHSTVVSASWSSGDARWTVEVRHAATGERTTMTLQLAVLRGRLLPLRRGFRPAFRGTRAVPGRDHPPAAMARGPRLRRPAGAGDRKRRHRRHLGPGDGGHRRARDDAPADAELHHGAAVGG